MNKTLTSKQYLSQLNLIYFAQAAMMAIFAAVVFALNYSGNVVVNQDENLSTILTYTLLAVVIAGFSSAHFLYGYFVSKIDSTLPLQQKMPKYSGAVIIRCACLELPGMFGAIVYYLTGNIFVLLIPVFSLIIFLLLRPTASSIAEDLNLSANERALLNQPDAVIAEIENPRKK